MEDFIMLCEKQLKSKILNPEVSKLPFQFCQSGFDSFSQDRVHDKVLVEEPLPAVLVPLEDHEVAVIGDFTTNRTNFLWVEEFGRGPEITR